MNDCCEDRNCGNIQGYLMKPSILQLKLQDFVLFPATV